MPKREHSVDAGMMLRRDDRSSVSLFFDNSPIPFNRAASLTLQGLEATLSDSKKKYGDKVNALLSAWEHVSNYIPAAPPEATQSLIEWAHRYAPPTRCCVHDYTANPRSTSGTHIA